MKILTLFVSCLLGSALYAQKIAQKPCDFESPEFREVMTLVQEDYKSTLSGQRIADSARYVVDYSDYVFTDRSKFIVTYKKAKYMGGVKYRHVAKNLISYDASRYEINYIMACTVYNNEGKWIILDADRISVPTRPSGIYSTFSEEREITIEPPTTSTDIKQYSILIYEQKSLNVENMFDGFSLYLASSIIFNNSPSYNSRYSFVLPKEIRPYIKQYDLEKSTIKNYVLSQETIGDFTTYIFSLDETNTQLNEPSSYTLDNRTFPYIGFSTFDSWDSINKYIKDAYESVLTKGDQAVITELELIAKENNIDKNEVTPEQIYYYVVNFYRYVYDHTGNGAYIPNPPKVTIKNKSGDCKDLSVLTTALLRAAGYEAVPILIRTSSMLNYDLDIPSTNFNHMIVKLIDKNGKDIFLDMTTEGSSGFGMLPVGDLDRNYITYTDLSIFKGRTPFSNPSSTDNCYIFQISECENEEKLNYIISTKKELCGMEAYLFYHNYTMLTDDKKEGYIKEIVSPNNDFCDMKEYSIQELSPEYVRIEARLNQEDSLIMYNNDMIVIRPNILAEDLSGIDKKSKRLLAFNYSDNDYCGPYEASFVYVVPENFEIEYMPEPFEYHSPYLDLFVKFEKIDDGKLVKFSRKSIYKEHIIPADKVLEEQEKMQELYNYRYKKALILRKKK